MIHQYDREALRREFRDASKPFPYIVIENFLEAGLAEQIAATYPSFEEAKAQGFAFNFVNEQKKVQITDVAKFPDPVKRLNEAISSPKFLSDLEYITGIPRLLADEQLSGGGMHVTGSGGRLDVHVDFNVLADRKLFRRLNILLYLNPVWQPDWGGHIELWDKEVKNCHYRCIPALNRCLIFETSEFSYHGVTRVTAPDNMTRQSFAAYYYTREAPAGWDGTTHSTIFRARPDEKFRGLVSMPVEKMGRLLRDKVDESKRKVKAWVSRASGTP